MLWLLFFLNIYKIVIHLSFNKHLTSKLHEHDYYKYFLLVNIISMPRIV